MNNQQRRFSRVFATSRMILLSASMLGGAAVPAFAQSAPAASPPADAQSSGLADIVVTARRVEERLQDVPLSITAFSAKQIADNQITQAQDIKSQVPNLTITKTAVTGGTQFVIRGQGSGNLPNISLDNRIGIYLDGIYVARTQGGSFSLADIERLEILKGPQGTQFGKNLTGGAISFITAGPTGKLGAIAETTIGNLGRKRFRVTLNTPTFGGFSARFTYVHDELDGEVRNLAAGRKYGNIVDLVPNPIPAPAPAGSLYPASGFNFPTRPSNKRLAGFNNETFFAALRYDNEAGFTIDLKGDLTNSLEYNSGLQTFGYANTFVGCSGAVIARGLRFDCSKGGTNGGINTLFAPLTSAAASSVPASFSKLHAIPQDLESSSPLRSRGLSLTTNYQINDDLTVRSITGYRKVFTPTQVDLDGGEIFLDTNAVNATLALGGIPALLPANQLRPYCLSCSFQFQRQNQISEELQLIGRLGDNVDFLGGLYYFREKGYSGNIYVANFSPLNGLFGFGLPPLSTTTTTEIPAFAFSNGDDTRIRSRSQAIYGRVTFRPVEQLDLVFGGRYTMDRKRNIISPTLQSQVIDSSTGRPPLLNRVVKDEKFTYDATATYHFTPDVNVYVRYATAYLAGGLLRNVAFEPETTKAGEIGLKSEWFDRRLRVNLAAFLQKSKNLQRATSLPPFGALVLQNIGSVKTKGFEAEVVALPIDGLTLNGNFGFTDYNPSDGSRATQARYAVQVGGTADLHEFEGGAKLRFGADGNWRSRYYTNPFSLLSSPVTVNGVVNVRGGYDPTQPLPPQVYAGYPSQLAYLQALEAATGLGKYWLVNTRLTLEDIDLGRGLKGRVSGWVRNVFDVQHVNFAGNYGTQIGSYFEQDRTYGIDFRLQF